ncbi:uncharacterized protein LOC114970706 [Acropora millepora]|uniref:uncharacterized protein LOC114970706 n=1 Tax=Acropora millepora TaxID=45264 RepID=UPI001CF5C159|nr:uncharacterized protein LOC114970706 [Acropora millepora]
MYVCIIVYYCCRTLLRRHYRSSLQVVYTKLQGHRFSLYLLLADVWQQINNDPVCFGARDDQYGAFSVTKTGIVKAMKLVHRHGSIKCNLNYPPTFWSCGNVRYYANNTFMTIITNAKREALLPSVENLKTARCSKEHYYVLEQVNQGSPELILGNLSRPLSFLKDQQLQIWYGQDWIDCSEQSNSGASCVDIFAWYV